MCSIFVNNADRKYIVLTISSVCSVLQLFQLFHSTILANLNTVYSSRDIRCNSTVLLLIEYRIYKIRDVGVHFQVISEQSGTADIYFVTYSDDYDCDGAGDKCDFKFFITVKGTNER